MDNAKDYLNNNAPELSYKLQKNALRTEVAELMEDFAIDFAASVMNTDEQTFRMTVKQMRDTQKLYFATRCKKALIQAKELEKKVDHFLNK